MTPGTGGIIANILYQDIVINNPVWWNIYIGPQQQNQPGDDKKAFCSMFYPFGDCATIAEVGMFNITLRNVETHGGILWPGVIRCNETMPCTGFVFDNVKHHSWWSMIGWNYFTENVYGTVTDSKPVPDFGQASNEFSVFPTNWMEDFIGAWTEFIGYYSDSCVTVGDSTKCHTEWRILLAKKISKLNKAISSYMPVF